MHWRLNRSQPSLILGISSERIYELANALWLTLCLDETFIDRADE